MGKKIFIPMWMLCDGGLGCDCREMRRKNNKRLRGGPLRHGERRMYQIGCHCDECVAANNEYQADYRKKEKV